MTTREERQLAELERRRMAALLPAVEVEPEPAAEPRGYCLDCSAERCLADEGARR